MGGDSAWKSSHSPSSMGVMGGHHGQSMYTVSEVDREELIKAWEGVGFKNYRMRMQLPYMRGMFSTRKRPIDVFCVEIALLLR